VGDYTAAAVASIAFSLPYAAVDGNVLRVLSRLTNDAGDIRSPVTRRRLQGAADGLLDPEQPGRFNQAMMELGATVCLPKRPQCLICPVAEHCEARRLGTQAELPVKIRRGRSEKIARTLLFVRKNGCLLMWRRPAGNRKLGGFWELPEPEHLPKFVQAESLGRFRHSIMNHDYTFEVVECDVGDCDIDDCSISKAPDAVCWVDVNILQKLLLSTTTRKALALISGRNLIGRG
ncbi:MAG: A/G-specific adenine glycosylase, partial [Bryobacteraceae bacterium]